jgi:hypothetical protein
MRECVTTKSGAKRGILATFLREIIEDPIRYKFHQMLSVN